LIYIVIPVHNRIEKTVKCIESIYRQSVDEIKTVVVDDGSTDKTQKVLMEMFPEVVVLQASGSLFWTGAIALGIDYVLSICNESDWVLLVNNDIQMEADTIEKLLNFAEKKNVIVNALSLDIADKDTIVKSGTRVNSWLLNSTDHVLQGKSFSKLKSLKAIQVDLLTGRCLLHPVGVFNKTGNYDSERFPHYGGDDEFSVRASSLGYKLYVLPTAIVYLDRSSNVNNLKRPGVLEHFFCIRSSSNIINKWNFTKVCVPPLARPTYYFFAVFKSVFTYLRG